MLQPLNEDSGVWNILKLMQRGVVLARLHRHYIYEGENFCWALLRFTPRLFRMPHHRQVLLRIVHCQFLQLWVLFRHLLLTEQLLMQVVLAEQIV